MPLCEMVRTTPHPGVLLGQLSLLPPSAKDLLYLFACSLHWRDRGDTTAGWDLIAGMRSNDETTQRVCTNLLAAASNDVPPARDVSWRDLRRWNLPNKSDSNLQPNAKDEMNTPYGLEMCESCVTCKLNQPGWFCHLSHEGLKALNAASHLTLYPGGALLFVEGQTPRGAFILCSGRVKLSTTSREGKVLIVRIAGPGSVLGLSAVVAGESYEVTAETSMPCQVNFVEREGLLRLLRTNTEAGLHATRAMSRDFQAAYRDIHDLMLARSSAGKLARLLLSWVAEERRSNPEARVHAAATHEEMAQMIGTSRETVTRLLSELRRKELIHLDGTTLIIRNRGALEALAA
jgi:CRP/FNR family cyclic AMP-dependent transcriptional regulator